MNANESPISVPPVDPERITAELRKRAETVQVELRRIEEAKKVSPETMRRVIDW